MLIDFNFAIKDMDGKDTGKTGASLVREFLGGRPDNIDVIKAWDWAEELKKNPQIDIDRADSDLLENALKKSQIFYFALAPIVLAIKAAK